MTTAPTSPQRIAESRAGQPRPITARPRFSAMGVALSAAALLLACGGRSSSIPKRGDAAVVDIRRLMADAGADDSEDSVTNGAGSSASGKSGSSQSGDGNSSQQVAGQTGTGSTAGSTAGGQTQNPVQSTAGNGIASNTGVTPTTGTKPVAGAGGNVQPAPVQMPVVNPATGGSAGSAAVNPPAVTKPPVKPTVTPPVTSTPPKPSVTPTPEPVPMAPEPVPDPVTNPQPEPQPTPEPDPVMAPEPAQPEPVPEPSPEPTPDIALQDNCTASYRTAGDNYCSMEAQCGEADSAQYYWGNCWDEGYGDWYCYCSGDQSYSFRVSELDSSNACNLSINLCASGEQPQPSGDVQCEPNSAYAGSGYCNYNVECSQSSEVDGATIDFTYSNYSYCNQYDSGSWSCSCGAAGNYLSFYLTEDAAGSGIDMCENAMNVCDGGDVQIDGPIECSPSFQSAGTDYCSTNLDCTQDLTVNSMSIQSSGGIYSQCNVAAEGEWDCECGSGGSSTSFSVSADQAWDACTEVNTLCEDYITSSGLSLVELSSGNGGFGEPGIGRPIPVDY